MPIVPHGHPNIALVFFDLDVGAASIAVLARIGEGFLDDAVRRYLELGSESLWRAPLLVREVDADIHLESPVAGTPG